MSGEIKKILEKKKKLITYEKYKIKYLFIFSVIFGLLGFFIGLTRNDSLLTIQGVFVFFVGYIGNFELRQQNTNLELIERIQELEEKLSK